MKYFKMFWIWNFLNYFAFEIWKIKISYLKKNIKTFRIFFKIVLRNAKNLKHFIFFFKFKIFEFFKNFVIFQKIEILSNFLKIKNLILYYFFWNNFDIFKNLKHFEIVWNLKYFEILKVWNILNLKLWNFNLSVKCYEHSKCKLYIFKIFKMSRIM